MDANRVVEYLKQRAKRERDLGLETDNVDARIAALIAARALEECADRIASRGL